MNITTINKNAINNDPYTARDEIDVNIGNILKRLGIATHKKSYFVIRRCIRMVVDNPDETQYITKEVYPSVAREFRTSAAAIERSIRSAISSIHCSEEDLIACIGWRSINYTNKQIVSGIAEVVRDSKNSLR